MKQTQNTRLFIGCPYEKTNILCKECPEFQKCQYMKAKRKKEKKQRSCVKSIALVLVIVGVILCFICFFNDEDGNVNNTTSTTTENTEFTHTTQTETTAMITMHTEVTKKAELSAYGPGDEYFYELSEEDKILIAKVVWKESRGECFEGQVAVAAVVLNRYYYGDGHPFDRKSIETVVTQPSQFANIANVTMEDLQAAPLCMEAVEAACKGWDPTRIQFSQGAFFFYAPKGVTGRQAEMREGIEVLVIGNHNFHENFDKVQ